MNFIFLPHDRRGPPAATCARCNTDRCCANFPLWLSQCSSVWAGYDLGSLVMDGVFFFMKCIMLTAAHSCLPYAGRWESRTLSHSAVGICANSDQLAPAFWGPSHSCCPDLPTQTLLGHSHLLIRALQATHSQWVKMGWKLVVSLALMLLSFIHSLRITTFALAWKLGWCPPIFGVKVAFIRAELLAGNDCCGGNAAASARMCWAQNESWNLALLCSSKLLGFFLLWCDRCLFLESCHQYWLEDIQMCPG